MVETGRAFGTARNRARWRMGYEPGNVALTPPYVLEPFRSAMGGFALDPCTEPDNPTGAETYYALPDNGLAHSWAVRSVWCNPPYGDAMGPWVARAIEAGQAGAMVALLIPARTEVARVQSVMNGADAVVFVAGRVAFGGRRPGNGELMTATHGSLVACWGFEPPTELGVVLR